MNYLHYPKSRVMSSAYSSFSILRSWGTIFESTWVLSFCCSLNFRSNNRVKSRSLLGNVFLACIPAFLFSLRFPCAIIERLIGKRMGNKMFYICDFYLPNMSGRNSGRNLEKFLISQRLFDWEFEDVSMIGIFIRACKVDRSNRLQKIKLWRYDQIKC